MEKEKNKFNRIRIVLAEKEKSNRYLASVLDLNENTVSRWVNNVAQPEIKTLFKIANILSVEVSSLLEGNATTTLDTSTASTVQTAYLVELFDKHGNALDLHLFRSLDNVTDYCKGVGVPLGSQQMQELETANYTATSNSVGGVGKVSCMVLEG